MRLLSLILLLALIIAAWVSASRWFVPWQDHAGVIQQALDAQFGVSVRVDALNGRWLPLPRVWGRLCADERCDGAIELDAWALIQQRVEPLALTLPTLRLESVELGERLSGWLRALPTLDTLEIPRIETGDSAIRLHRDRAGGLQWTHSAGWRGTLSETGPGRLALEARGLQFERMRDARLKTELDCNHGQCSASNLELGNDALRLRGKAELALDTGATELNLRTTGEAGALLAYWLDMDLLAGELQGEATLRGRLGDAPAAWVISGELRVRAQQGQTLPWLAQAQGEGPSTLGFAFSRDARGLRLRRIAYDQRGLRVRGHLSGNAEGQLRGELWIARNGSWQAFEVAGDWQRPLLLPRTTTLVQPGA